MFDWLKKPLTRKGQEKLKGKHKLDTDLPSDSNLEDLVLDHMNCDVEDIKIKDVGDGNYRITNSKNNKKVRVKPPKRGQENSRLLCNPHLSMKSVHQGCKEEDEVKVSRSEFQYSSPELVEKLMTDLNLEISND